MRHPCFDPPWVTNEPTPHVARAHTLLKLQTKTLMYSHRYTIFSGEKQYTVMWQVLWLSPLSERTRPYVEASERKLRDVGFFGTSSKSKEEIKNFQRERVSKQLLYILIRAFSKMRILS